MSFKNGGHGTGRSPDLINISVPCIDPRVRAHHKRALNTIARSPETDRGLVRATEKGWRKRIHAFKRNGQNGYDFDGQWLLLGEKVDLPRGSVFLAVDTSSTKAADAPREEFLTIEKSARLFLVTDQGYELLLETNELSWAQKVSKYLLSNSKICAKSCIQIREEA